MPKDFCYECRIPLVVIQPKYSQHYCGLCEDRFITKSKFTKEQLETLKFKYCDSCDNLFRDTDIYKCKCGTGTDNFCLACLENHEDYDCILRGEEFDDEDDE